MSSPETLPILVVAFRRPKSLEVVLKSIANKPNPIYIWLDGPRNSSDASDISDCVQVIYAQQNLNLIEVSQSPHNVGIGFSIPTAIDWVFNFVSQVVILEDDIVIDSGFLEFAAFCLNKYEKNPDISSVIGFNCVPKSNISKPNDNLRFSIYTSSWAWGTWRDKWDFLAPYMLEGRPISFKRPKSVRGLGGRLRWGELSRKIRDGNHVSWDHRWLLVNWHFKRTQVVSNFNLCRNIGFDSDSTHTFIRPTWIPDEIENLIPNAYPFLDPKQDILADRWIAKYVYRSTTMLMLKNRIKNYLTSWLF
jgi:hypothetical protein